MKYIFVTLAEFLENGGIIEKDRELFNKDGKILGEYLEFKDDMHLMKNGSYLSMPISEIIAYVKIEVIPLYNDDRIKQMIIQLGDYGNDVDKYCYGLPNDNSNIDDMIRIAKYVLSTKTQK